MSSLRSPDSWVRPESFLSSASFAIRFDPFDNSCCGRLCLAKMIGEFLDRGSATGIDASWDFEGERSGEGEPGDLPQAWDHGADVLQVALEVRSDERVGGTTVKDLEVENRKLKQLLAEAHLDNGARSCIPSQDTFMRDKPLKEKE